MAATMMKCGCASNATHKNAHNGLEDSHSTCIIHGVCEVDASPNLKNRTARCTYFGKTKPNRRFANDECNYGCQGKQVCECGSVKSDTNLAFFKHKAEATQDEFYCGCWGWD